MFDVFTDDLRAVFDAALRCRDEHLLTDHLLYGAARLDGPAAEVLAELGVRDAILAEPPEQLDQARELGATAFSPGAKRLFQVALQAARARGADAIDSLDLLAAMATDDPSGAKDLLRNAGTDPGQLTTSVDSYRSRATGP